MTIVQAYKLISSIVSFLFFRCQGEEKPVLQQQHTSFNQKTQRLYKNKEKAKKDESWEREKKRERERYVLRIVFLTLKKCTRVSQKGLFSL